MTSSPLYHQVASFAPTGNLSLIMAIVWIINTDFAQYTITAVTLGQFSRSVGKKRYHYDLMDEILKRASIYRKRNTDGRANIKYMIEGETMDSNDILLNKLFNNLSDEELFQRDYGNRDKAIWFMDSLESFNRLESHLLSPRSHYHRNGRFCIVYTGTGSNRLQNIKIIFERLFQLYVTNINVIIMIGRTPYVYTYFPYDASRCQASTPKLYASFAGISDNKDFYFNKPFFPYKLRNMQRCKLAVATWHVPPMIFINENNDSLPRIHGIEGNILNLLAERMNFSINLVKDPDGRGLIFKNGTATGALKLVLDGKANFTISNYLYDKTIADYLLPSQTYMNIPIVVAIPKGHPMSPFVRLTRPFKYIIWSCLSSSLLLGMLIIFSIKLLNHTHISHFVFGNSNRIPFTNLWSTFFGGSISGNLPKRNFARYILAVWLLYTLVMRNAYIGELYIILQDGRSKTQLRTIGEVVQNNFTIFASRTFEDLLRYTRSKANLQFMDTTKSNYVPNLLEELQTNENSKKVILLLGPTVRYFNRGIYNSNQRINVLPAPLFTVPITLYMRPHSYLHRHINEFLINMMSSGLISRNEAIYLENNFNFIKPTQVPIALSFWLLFGLFSVYFVLLIFCSLVFLLELWTKNSRIARGIIGLFNC